MREASISLLISLDLDLSRSRSLSISLDRSLSIDLSRSRLHLDRLSRGQLGEQQRQVGAGAHADLLHAQPARPVRGERVVRQQQRAHALVGERVAAHVERIEHLGDIGER
jgi:hypothetical protein